MARVCTKYQLEKSAGEFSKASAQSRSADGLRRWCRTCDKAYRDANKERRAALADAYYKLHQKQKQEYGRKRYLVNRVEHAAKTKLWRSQNKELVAELGRAWRLKNPERVRVNQQRRSKEVRNANEAARRARKRGASGTYTPKDVARIFELQRGTCPVCRGSLGVDFHRDHILPLARGGTNYPDNIQLLCAHCNLTKQARDPIEFMQSRGLLL